MEPSSQAEAILQGLPIDEYVKDAEPTLLITCEQVQIKSFDIFIFLIYYTCLAFSFLNLVNKSPQYVNDL